MKFFNILPSGAVKAGKADYDAVIDGEMVDLTYDITAQVKVFFFTKNVQNSGKYTVNKQLLVPANLKEIGKTIQIADVTFTILSCDDNHSVMSLTVSSHSDWNGHLVVLTGPRDVCEVASATANISAPVVGALSINLVPIAQKKRVEGV